VGDVRDRDRLAHVLDAHDIDTVYHLASLLSVTSEQRPDHAWDVNLTGLKHILDLARERALRVFWPSSIAVFGPGTPEHAPQDTVLDPITLYGVTKRSGELLCRYYHRRYDLDVRSLRLPGLVSHKTAPGGGTTDYAVDMCRHAARGTTYSCFLAPDTPLPFLYMPDALRAIRALMDAPASALTVHDSYNLGGLTATPRQVARALQCHVPTFSCTYAPDARQRIADSWPASVDDSAARTDWGWAPTYDLAAMTADMLDHLTANERADRAGRS
jgi:nucleoside-diphosphate-sugar epimerase